VKLIRKLLLSLGLVVVLIATSFWLRPVFFFDEWTYAREFLAGVESRSVVVAGHRVHYLAEGPSGGPVVVLVHGLGGRAEDWTNLAPWLVKAGYRVYMPDLPGYGRSEEPADFSYSVPDEAGVVIGFLHALNLKQVDLGGWSMGGWIVQRIAIEHPDHVRRLMLFDTAGLYAKPLWDTGLFTSSTPEQLKQFYALLMPNPPNVPAFVVRDILRITKEKSWITQRALASMLSGRDVTDSLLPKLQMPVLLVWGQADRITPLSQGEKIHDLIPRSQLEVIPGCGHLAPSQCAAPIGPKVVEFLKE